MSTSVFADFCNEHTKSEKKEYEILSSLYEIFVLWYSELYDSNCPSKTVFKKYLTNTGHKIRGQYVLGIVIVREDSESDEESETPVVPEARAKVTEYIEKPILPIKKKAVRDRMRRLTPAQAKKVYNLEQKIYNCKLKEYKVTLQIRRLELGLDRSK